jgi:hypothetical protein
MKTEESGSVLLENQMSGLHHVFASLRVIRFSALEQNRKDVLDSSFVADFLVLGASLLSVSICVHLWTPGFFL